MKFFLILVGAVFLLSIGGFLFVDHFTGVSSLTEKQKQVALENMLGRPANLKEKGPIVWKTYNGKLFRIAIPKDATVSMPKLSNTLLDGISFSVLSDRVLVSVLIKKGDLEDDSGVTIRTTQADTYTATQTAIAGCLAFVKTADTDENDLFCAKNENVMSLVVSGTNMQNVAAYFSSLI
ncbi:MAG: hypothetical protein ACREGI_02935, partial [Candidatus Levyibacteriota bacterium]